MVNAESRPAPAAAAATAAAAAATLPSPPSSPPPPTNTTKPLRVGVLGAGPAGLTVALALERYAGDAVQVTIIDKNSGVSDYEGVEYAIQERACHAFERMGVKDAVLKRGNPMREFAFYDERRQKKQISVTKDPRYCFEVFRQHFLADLEAQLDSTAVRRSTLVTGITFENAAADDGNASGALTVRVIPVVGDDELASGGAGSEESELEFDVVVSCEGIHSPTRRQLFPAESTLREYDFHILYTLVEAHDAATMPAHFREIANGSYLQFNMSHSTTNSFFPLGDNRLAVAIIFNTATRNAAWTRLGADPATPWSALDRDTKKAVAAHLAADTKVFDNLFSRLVDLVPDWNSNRIYAWSVRDTDPLAVPYARNANAILIGDAAHAMLPCIGEGANTAIEDAERLARLLADFATSRTAAAAAAAAASSPPLRAADLRARVFAPFAAARVPLWKDLSARNRRAVPNFTMQKSVSGFTVAPYIPIPAVAYAFALGERVRDWWAGSKAPKSPAPAPSAPTAAAAAAVQKTATAPATADAAAPAS
ncbi:hypothetical protein DFJ73DRAFT_803225 [Zopfochytrium polystomum]|nr:hypothetical protein DFJ73DRAFT_803225 [Zopfochytrium polystomum]